MFHRTESTVFLTDFAETELLRERTSQAEQETVANMEARKKIRFKRTNNWTFTNKKPNTYKDAETEKAHIWTLKRNNIAT